MFYLNYDKEKYSKGVKQMQKDQIIRKDLKGFILTLAKSAKSMLNSFPFFVGIVILMGLFKVFIPNSVIYHIFTGNAWLDTAIGSLFGSILAGNPINSYIIANFLLKDGISLFAVTSFIVAWVTVGITQLPYEIQTLGKRFTIARNLSSFILSMFVSLITVVIVRALS